MHIVRFNAKAGESEYNSRSVWEQARERGGLKVVESNDMHLQLDFDRPISAQDEEVFKLLKEVTNVVRDHLDTTSQNGNTHRYIRLTRPVNMVERLLLHAALGSDGKREILSLCRHNGHSEPVACLFETVQEYPRVMEFLGLQAVEIQD
jgi:hypothetical protein